MNKQELIEKYKSALNKVHKVYGDYYKTEAYEEVLKDLKQLDEPDKPVVPQFVAGWIKYCKFTGVELQHALDMGDLYIGNYANQKDYLKLKDFFEVEGNQDLFARAWLDGYEIEKEKRYTVKMKGVDSRTNYLYYGMGSKTWLFKTKLIDGTFRKSHTRKELEEANFGWVFDCEGVEVEEVTE